jgi:hypothetical protein
MAGQCINAMGTKTKGRGHQELQSRWVFGKSLKSIFCGKQLELITKG